MPVTSGAAHDQGDHRPEGRALIACWLSQITSRDVLNYASPVALASIAAGIRWPETAATGAFSTGPVVSTVAGIAVALSWNGPLGR